MIKNISHRVKNIETHGKVNYCIMYVKILNMGCEHFYLLLNSIFKYGTGTQFKGKKRLPRQDVEQKFQLLATLGTGTVPYFGFGSDLHVVGLANSDSLCDPKTDIGRPKLSVEMETIGT
jgi:hypothetical protein